MTANPFKKKFFFCRVDTHNWYWILWRLCGEREKCRRVGWGEPGLKTNQPKRANSKILSSSKKGSTLKRKTLWAQFLSSQSQPNGISKTKTSLTQAGTQAEIFWCHKCYIQSYPSDMHWGSLCWGCGDGLRVGKPGSHSHLFLFLLSKFTCFFFWFGFCLFVFLWKLIILQWSLYIKINKFLPPPPPPPTIRKSFRIRKEKKSESCCHSQGWRYKGNSAKNKTWKVAKRIMVKRVSGLRFLEGGGSQPLMQRGMEIADTPLCKAAGCHSHWDSVLYEKLLEQS